MNSVSLVFILYIALNSVVSLCFIPLGKTFNSGLSLIASWTVILLCLKLPTVLLSSFFEKLSSRFGIKKVILSFIFVAICIWGIFILVYPHTETWGLVALYASFSVFFSVFEYLFPSYIYQINSQASVLKKSLSNWHITVTLSRLISVFIGGIFVEYFKLYDIFVMKLIVFAIVFPFLVKVLVNIKKDQKKIKESKLNLVARDSLLVIRKILFGMMNPVIPLFIVKKMQLSETYLGGFYCLLGVTAMGGAILYKKVNFKREVVNYLIALEMLSFCAILITMNPYVFVIGMGIIGIVFPGIDIFEQYRFISTNDHNTDKAAVWFKNFMVVGLIIGFILSGVIY